MIFVGSFKCIHTSLSRLASFAFIKGEHKLMGGTGALSNCTPIAHILLQDIGFLFCTKLISGGVFVTITCRDGLQFLYSCSTFRYMQSTVPVWRITMMRKLDSQFSFMQTYVSQFIVRLITYLNNGTATLVVSWVMALNTSALVIRLSSSIQ